MKLANFGIILLLVSPLPAVAWPLQNSSSGQSASTGQQESLAEAARRAQEQKKEEPKPTKVWTNDDVPKTDADLSIIGPPSEAASAESSEESKTEKKPAAMTAAEKADLETKLEDAKEQLASLKIDLNILERKYPLDEQTYLSNPNHEHDTAGAEALDDEKQQIADKEKEIAEAQKKVDDLQVQVVAASLAPAVTSSSNSPTNNGPPQ
jgi:hypothetical protein